MSADLPAYGAGYLAKFGPTNESKVFWVDPVTGTRLVGDAQKFRARWITTLLEIDAKYPVVGGAVTLEQQAQQDAINNKTLRQARRDVAAKILAATEQ